MIMTIVDIWNNSGSLEFTRNGWRRVLSAAYAGGWEPLGVIEWDERDSPTAERSMDYFCECTGGTADPADANAMADGLQRYMDERLTIRDFGCDDLTEDEQSEVRTKLIPLLRSDGFAVLT